MRTSFAMTVLAALAVLAAATRGQAPDVAVQDSQSRSDPACRQFDFWVGEWSVQNRHLRPGPKWIEGGVTRARITPVLGGGAILEEWSGPLRPDKRMSGFSLRAYDAHAKEWVILLNWSESGGSAFHVMRGGFRHGRGEFKRAWRGPSDARMVERYTFSDGLADTVRWDQARSNDGGETWRTDWIMEFSRTAPAAGQSLQRVFNVDWQAGNASPHAEARWLDFAVGTWVCAKGPGAPWRIRAGLVGEKRLVVLSKEKQAADKSWRATELWVASYVPARSAWEAWMLHSSDLRFQRWEGKRLESGALRFRRGEPASSGRSVTLAAGESGALVWSEATGGPSVGLGVDLVFRPVGK